MNEPAGIRNVRRSDSCIVGERKSQRISTIRAQAQLLEVVSDSGAHEVVIGVTGDQDEVLCQLDAHRALTTRFD